MDAEIAEPLGADVQIGAREVDRARVADLVGPPPAEFPALDPDSVAARTFLGVPLAVADAHTDAWRNAELGAVNGHGNARSLARALSVISRGGRAGASTILGSATVDELFRRQHRGTDLVLGLPIDWGLGVALGSGGTLPWLPRDGVAFWGGWGGSMVVMDTRARMTIAYTMNRMAPGVLGSDRAAEYVAAAYRALGDRRLIIAAD